MAAPSVTGDDVSGIRQAIDHLQELGHTRVAHLAGPQDTSTGVARLRAFRAEVEERGIDFGDRAVAYAKSFSVEEGRRAMHELLDAGDIGAVLAGNDLLALGGYDAARERNLRIPEDLSVVGFNDLPMVDRIAPSLTTIRLPHYDLGVEAARLMLEVLSQRGTGETSSPKAVLLPVELMVRGSTGRAPTPGPEV